MALPVILVDSATGSDTQASGAGSTTAVGVNGTASTSADGLTITMPNVDLTNVPTDGSATVFVNDGTAGGRNHGKITSKANSGSPTAQVGVSDAFGALLTLRDAWTGGKRASVFNNANSRKLFENNSGNGDGMAGWIVEMLSGHSETHNAVVTFHRSGSSTDGPITLRGASGASMLPLLTATHDDNFIRCFGASWIVRDFEMRNSNTTKTASRAIIAENTSILFDGLKVSHSTDRFWQGIATFNSAAIPYGFRFLRCNVGHTVSHGISFIVATLDPDGIIDGCSIHHCGGDGVFRPTTDSRYSRQIVLRRTQIWECTGHGYHSDGSVNNTNNRPIHDIDQCVFYSNGGDGIRIVGATRGDLSVLCQNNIFKNNGGWGINFSSSPTLAQLRDGLCRISHNNHHGNTSGFVNVSGIDEATQNVDPQFVDAANGNFTPGAVALEGTAFPGLINGISNFGWPGVIQPEDAGGGGGARSFFVGQGVFGA